MIDLLPALPTAWPDGSATGLRARGGFEVDLSWAHSRLTRITLRSKLGNPCILSNGSRNIELNTRRGGEYTFNAELQPAP